MSCERPVILECGPDKLVGILHTGRTPSAVGVVIVVGGPQYRVGSHRQFVLMARRLSAAGIPVLRFDCRGMGDSIGQFRSFEGIDDDIQAAVDCITAEVPEVSEVLLLGLCDGASSSLMYCTSDERVAGLVLLNPWVRTTAGEAKAYLRHYYVQRLFQRSLWRKVISGKFSLLQSGRDLSQSILAAIGSRSSRSRGSAAEQLDFVSRMRKGLEEFGGTVLVLISGRDLTAAEFMDLCSNDRRWKDAINHTRVEIVRLPDADHTMSARSDLEAACAECIEWITKNQRPGPAAPVV